MSIFAHFKLNYTFKYRTWHNVTLHAKVCNLILETKVSSYKINLKLLFSRKHAEDVLVFFSQLDINERKLCVG